MTCIGCGSEVAAGEAHGIVDCQTASRNLREKLQAENSRLTTERDEARKLAARGADQNFADSTWALLDNLRRDLAAERTASENLDRVRKEQEIRAQRFQQENVQLKADLAFVREALEESVKLQSHYAELLNMHDGGARLTFADAQAWMDRLKRTTR